jgi:phosphoribosyl-dephospho-CoA transferase
MLQRHQLVWLNDAGWREIDAAEWDTQARQLFALWAAQGLPLVVTRQRSDARLALGLPAPLSFDRRRIAVEVGHESVLRRGEFPSAESIEFARHDTLRAHWQAMCRALAASGCAPRVYGGHGWQAITGLAYVHPASDVDLLLPATGTAMADAVCHVLIGASPSLPRLDGELVFPDGAGIAWREWRQWRGGRARQLLVKRLRGASLECPSFAHEVIAC